MSEVRRKGGEEEGEVLEGFQFLSELLSPNKNGLSLDTSSNFVISQRERELSPVWSVALLSSRHLAV